MEDKFIEVVHKEGPTEVRIGDRHFIFHAGRLGINKKVIDGATYEVHLGPRKSHARENIVSFGGKPVRISSVFSAAVCAGCFCASSWKFKAYQGKKMIASSSSDSNKHKRRWPFVLSDESHLILARVERYNEWELSCFDLAKLDHDAERYKWDCGDIERQMGKSFRWSYQEVIQGKRVELVCCTQGGYKWAKVRLELGRQVFCSSFTPGDSSKIEHVNILKKCRNASASEVIVRLDGKREAVVVLA